MSITYVAQTKTFFLNTSSSTYAFCVRETGRLVHLYYGPTVGQEDLRDMARLTTWHSSNEAVDFDDEATFSPNTSMMEFGSAGAGDFRPAALTVMAPEGNTVTDVRYVSHKISPGKVMPKGLPALQADETAADTLEVLCRDACTGVEVTLVYTVFRDAPIITRHNRIENRGTAAVRLLDVSSASVSLPDANMDLCYLPGNYLHERSFAREQVARGTHIIGSARGESSHYYNPFCALVSKDATEDHGDVYAFSFVYSSSFRMTCHRDCHETLRLNVGMNPDTFAWQLEVGETFTTPETVMLYTDGGLGEMTRIYHRLIRAHLLHGEWKDKKRPLLINSWEAAYFDFDDEKLVAFAKEAKALGVELLVMDDGWFSRRSSDDSSLGDWWVNEQKLKGGLASLVERVHAEGLGFGIWFEPEMISPNSDLYRAHPDWCLHVEGRPHSNCRNQYVLDLSRPEVVDCIFDQMSAVLDSAPIDYVKWDFNRPMTQVGSSAWPAERQMELQHRVMLGAYSLYEKFTTRYPHILLENCASGGGRFDLGMLYYAPQIWASDNTDAYDRLSIQFGTALCYPTSTMGAHVSANGRTPYAFKGEVALFGTFGYELNPTQLSDETRELFRQQIARYHATYDVIHNGELYRLISPWESDERVAWMHVLPDRSEAYVACAIVRKSIVEKTILKLKGLDPDATYEDVDRGVRYSGARLMHVGINCTPMGEAHRDYSSFGFHLKRVNEG